MDPELAETCGATGMVVMIIEKRVYSFHIGDCKSYLFRNNILYQMNIDHLPVIYILNSGQGWWED